MLGYLFIFLQICTCLPTREPRAQRHILSKSHDLANKIHQIMLECVKTINKYKRESQLTSRPFLSSSICLSIALSLFSFGSMMLLPSCGYFFPVSRHTLYRHLLFMLFDRNFLSVRKKRNTTSNFQQTKQGGFFYSIQTRKQVHHHTLFFV